MKNILLSATFIASSITAVHAQSLTLDERLSDLELRTSKFISGKEKMAAGFAQLPQNIRQIGCGAYSLKSDEEAIAAFRKEIAAIDAPESESAPNLNQDQAARLAAQKDTVSKLSPGIDCSKL